MTTSVEGANNEISNLAHSLVPNFSPYVPRKGTRTKGKNKSKEVVKATIKTAAPMVYDPYDQLSEYGSAILIDETSNSTVAAVLIKS